MDTIAAAGSSPPPRASSTARCAACRRCQSTRCVRPARGVQKSNRHGRDLVCMPSCPEDVHRTVAHGRRRRASFGAWLSRRAGALRHAHLHSLGRAAGLRASVNRGIARTRRRRPSVLCMTLSAPCRATPRAALVPGAVDLAGLLVLAVLLSSLAVPPQLNDCSHGRPRVSQTGLARSATAPGALRALFRLFFSYCQSDVKSDVDFDATRFFFLVRTPAFQKRLPIRARQTSRQYPSEGRFYFFLFFLPLPFRPGGLMGTKSLHHGWGPVIDWPTALYAQGRLKYLGPPRHSMPH